MTIVSVKEGWSKRTSNSSSADGRIFEAQYVRMFQVEHSVDATEVQIGNADGIPRLGQLHPVGFVPCTNLAISKLGPSYSHVIATYRGETNEDGDEPWNDDPEYTWTDTNSTEPIDQDWNGNPIVTANGEPITGVTMEIADPVVNVKKNFLAYDPHLTHAYRHSTNSDSFLSYPPGTARLIAQTATSKVWTSDDEGMRVEWWEVQAKIQFRYPFNTTADKAWYARVRHEGFYIRLGGKIVRATDCNKEPTTKPALLKEDGTRNLKSDSQCEDDPESAHWLEFQRYGSLPYSGLGLT